MIKKWMYGWMDSKQPVVISVCLCHRITITLIRLINVHSNKIAKQNDTHLDQSVYQKYGPNLQKIATEMKPFDLTSYIYWL